MKKNYLLKMRLLIVVLITFIYSVNGQITQTFTHTGAMQTFTVPSCVSTITVNLRSASGGTAGVNGALGSIANGVMTVTAGQVLYIFVGGVGTVPNGGFNGGGDGGSGTSTQGAGGGGASDIRTGGFALINRVLVAAGGGGAGGSATYNPIPGAGGAGTACGAPLGVGGANGNGCAAGTPGGCAGGVAASYGTGGAGGGLNSGGGLAGSPTGGFGQAGALGQGGNGGGSSGIYGGGGGGVIGGGGGGGGYYGGSGAMSGNGGCNGGGGGGSSYGDNVALTNITFSSTALTGHGQVTLLYTQIGTSVTAVANPFATCNGSTSTLTATGCLTYTWSNGSNSPVITVNPGVTTTYTISGSNALGCISTTVLTLPVSTSAPVLSVISSTNALCLGKTATLTASGALTYTWSNGVTNGVSFLPGVTTTYTVSGQNGCGTTTAVTTISVTPLALAAVASPTSICAGSPATLSAVSPGTLFTWQPFALSGASIAVNPSVTTIYTVSVTDGTCSGVANLTLVAKPVPTINIASSSSLICQGALVTMTASGGLGYTWTPGGSNASNISANPLNATLFSVVGSNSLGCTTSANQIVITNPSPTLSIGSDFGTICLGASANLTVSGAPSYVWSNGSTSTLNLVSPPSAIVYSVIGTFTTGCASTATIAVNVYAPNVSVSGNTLICNGGSATLSATSANSYNWNFGATGSVVAVNPNTTTSYTLSAISNSNGVNCTTTNTIQVVVNPNPTITAVASRSIICRGEASTLTAAGAPNFTWSVGTSSVSVKITPTITTTYSVSGTDANGCSGSGSVKVTVNSCLGLNEINLINDPISIFPNPSNGQFTISSNEDMDLEIINEVGQRVKFISASAESPTTHDVKDLPAGVYFIVGIKNHKQIKAKLLITD